MRQFRDHAYAASLLEQKIEILQSDREKYPGWLVCPPSLRLQIQMQISDPLPTASNIASLSSDSRTKLLYEIAWRHSLTFELAAPWLTQEFVKIADPDIPCAISKRQQMEIALLLLKNTRWYGNEQTVIKELALWATTILKKYAQYLPDCAAEIAYHQAIVARDTLDYLGIETHVGNIVGEDPVWKLRQASMLAELGRFEEGEHLISEAYRELNERHRHDTNSIRILSRLSWAHWLLHGAQMWLSDKSLIALTVDANRKLTHL
jgi:hypothetical protein